jgi:hypothetical protein
VPDGLWLPADSVFYLPGGLRLGAVGVFHVPGGLWRSAFCGFFTRFAAGSVRLKTFRELAHTCFAEAHLGRYGDC